MYRKVENFTVMKWSNLKSTIALKKLASPLFWAPAPLPPPCGAGGAWGAAGKDWPGTGEESCWPGADACGASYGERSYGELSCCGASCCGTSYCGASGWECGWSFQAPSCGCGVVKRSPSFGCDMARFLSPLCSVMSSGGRADAPARAAGAFCDCPRGVPYRGIGAGHDATATGMGLLPGGDAEPPRTIRSGLGGHRGRTVHDGWWTPPACSGKTSRMTP